VGSKQPTYPELLARVDALGMTDKAVEQAAGLPQAFLSKARKGGQGGAKAAASWGRLLAWLEAREPGSKAAPSTPPAPVVEPSREVPEDLARAIDEAHTHERIGALQTRIASSATRGEIDRFLAKVLSDILKERRLALDAEEEAKAKASGSAPMEIRIAYVNDWREGTVVE
jgi:hypothetical protein